MSIIIRLVLNWIAKNAVAKVYTSPIPLGKHLGGNDIPQVQDLYVIFDVRIVGRIIYLGYFQAT